MCPVALALVPVPEPLHEVQPPVANQVRADQLNHPIEIPIRNISISVKEKIKRKTKTTGGKGEKTGKDSSEHGPRWGRRISEPGGDPKESRCGSK